MLFLFGLAGLPFPDQINGSVGYIDASRLLYVSDFPCAPRAGVEMLAQSMDKHPVLFREDAEWDAIMHGRH
jgi:hypothetical protein